MLALAALRLLSANQQLIRLVEMPDFSLEFVGLSTMILILFRRTKLYE